MGCDEMKIILSFLLISSILTSAAIAKQDLWLVTAYCNCKKCCGKEPMGKGYGITASGKQTCAGCCACNWLPFGTKLNIEGMGEFMVMDRGARSLFGSNKNKIKHLDIWFPTHQEALNFGKQYKKVEVKDESYQSNKRVFSNRGREGLFLRAFGKRNIR